MKLYIQDEIELQDGENNNRSGSEGEVISPMVKHYDSDQIFL
jgi:hypothetical protein